MSNDPNINLDNNIDLSKIIENLKNNTIPDLTLPQIKKLFSELELNNDFSELFYNSLKNLFDMGFKLANNLNLDVLLDEFDKTKQEKE